jgi:putative flippase GtrA
MSIDGPRHLAGRGSNQMWVGFKSHVAAAFDFHLSKIKIIDAGRRDLLIRFVAIGFVNTAFGYGLFAVLYAISQSHRAAIVLATAAGTIFNFLTTGRLVFSNAKLSRLVPFVLCYGFVAAINIALVDLGVAVGLNPFIGQAFALPATVGLAFVINDRIVFRRTR